MARLAEVEARLRAVDDASGSHDLDVTVRPVEALRVAVRSGVAASYDPASINAGRSAAVRRGHRGLGCCPPASRGAGAVRYERDRGTRYCVDVCFPVEAGLGPRDGFAVVDLPRIDHAAIALHQVHGGGDGDDRVVGLVGRPFALPVLGGQPRVYLDCAGARDTWAWRSRNRFSRDRPRPGDDRNPLGGPMPHVDSYPAGVPCWVETLQPDLAAAMRFYAGVFGWTMVVDDEDRPTYAVASLRGQEVAGIASATALAVDRRGRLVHAGPRRRSRRDAVAGGRVGSDRRGSGRSTPTPPAGWRSSPIRAVRDSASGKRPPGREPRS